MLELLGCILLLYPSLVHVLMLFVAINVNRAEYNRNDMRLTGGEVGDNFVVEQYVLVVVACVIIVHIFALN